PHTPTTEIYTLSLHDALPILKYAAGKLSDKQQPLAFSPIVDDYGKGFTRHQSTLYFTKFQKIDPAPKPTTDDATTTTGVYNNPLDRKSTRLNSSHVSISYAVF